MHPEAADLIVRLGLEPLEAEGGWFCQSWRSPELLPSGEPTGTCIYALQTDEPDCFSAMHRLPTDEIWHFYLGDPLGLLLLHPDGSSSEPVLGPDLAAGHQVQLVVSAGTWMGGRIASRGGYALVGCTMAPGFTETGYEGTTAAPLIAKWPQHETRIRSLVRADGPRHMSPQQPSA
jgi:uncharacterized protein